MTTKNVWTRALMPALLILFVGFLSPIRLEAQNSEKPAPKLSEEEAKAIDTINTAPDARGKLTAATEFVKKYPKSEARMQIAEYVANHIVLVADGPTKLSLAEEFQKVFPAAEEAEFVRPALLDGYVKANRIDDAFTTGNALLAKNPEDVYVLVQLTFAGTEEAKKRNPKFVTQSLQYGEKAIQLIEADKRPEAIDEANWGTYKGMLGQLYQQTGALLLISGKPAEAKAKLEKAIEADPKEPSSYVLFGYVINDEYINLATNYKAMPEGPDKEATLKTIEGMMDKMIDLYARAVGLATGRPEYQSLIQQVMPDLTSYYKYRHNQSEAGLQQLIDKYKTSATP